MNALGNTSCLIFCIAAASACTAQDTSFDVDDARPVAGTRGDKSDGIPRTLVEHLRVGRYPFDDPQYPCEEDEVRYRVSYRPGALFEGTQVYLHHGFAGFDNYWIGDGFCWDTTYLDWQDIRDTEMKPTPDGAWVADISNEGASVSMRNFERECQLWPNATPQHLLELDFVFQVVHADGSVDWDTPDGRGFGSYYAAKSEGSLTFYCEDQDSHWEPLASW